MPAHPIAHIGPAFEEHSAIAVFFDTVQAAFESDEETPGLVILLGHSLERLGALPGSLHQFSPARRGVRHAARYVHADDFELGAGMRARSAVSEVRRGPCEGQHRADFVEGVPNSGELRFASTSDCDNDAVHKG